MYLKEEAQNIMLRFVMWFMDFVQFILVYCDWHSPLMSLTLPQIRQDKTLLSLRGNLTAYSYFLLVSEHQQVY